MKQTRFPAEDGRIVDIHCAPVEDILSCWRYARKVATVALDRSRNYCVTESGSLSFTFADLRAGSHAIKTVETIECELFYRGLTLRISKSDLNAPSRSQA